MPANTRHTPREAIAAAGGEIAAQCRNALSAIARSVHPSADDAWLIDAELKAFRLATRHSAPTLIVGAFIVTQACAPWVPWATRTTWWLTLAAVGLIIHFTSLRLDRSCSDSLTNIRLRARYHVGVTVVFTALWCSMTIFLWAPNQPLDHMVLLVVLACSLAGSIAVNAVHPAIALTAFLLHAGFIVGPFSLSPAPLDHTFAGLSLIYVLLLAGQSVGLNATMTKMYRLEHERSTLVEGLQQAKGESDRDRQRAVAAGRAKSQFLSNMSHELRTPMNAILGFSEIIKRKAFGDAVDKYAEYAAIIHESGEHLLSMINDVLDLARIEGGRLSLREAEIDLSNVIAEAVESNLSAAEQSHLSLARRVAAGLPRLLADERAVRQIVVNLLSNALKFTPPGGCVTVFAQVEADGRLAFGVEDTGIGIAEEDQATAFERFGKGRHDVTTADKGTGLGLAVVKGFAEAHDGTVTLESELGTGTRVTVYLPASRACVAEILRKEAS